MLIGNWSDIDTKNDLNFSKYYIIINGEKINLKQLNKHVLECILPQFDSDNKDFHNNSSCSEPFSTLNISNTFVNIFENEKLFCAPIPFKIKHSNLTDSSERKMPIAHLSQISNSKENINYKIKLFLLERTLMLLKYYNLNEIEYDYYNATSNVNLSTDKNISSFEKRICKLIVNLVNHVLLIKAKAHMPKNLNDDHAKLALESEHEGKTLLHLSSEAGLFYLLENLRIMKNHVQDDLSREFSIIKNELQLNKLDVHGNTPMVMFFYSM